VALGEVGIVGSRELSRLSRTDKDWCRLLEVCQIFGTLIADEQQVYDLNYLDDQLVLGIKGTLSVVELKIIRQRLLAGQESKARRGELFNWVCPRPREKDCISSRPSAKRYNSCSPSFENCGECVRHSNGFRDHDVELPANPIQGTRLVWKIPSQSLIRDILCNPFLCWRLCLGTGSGNDVAGWTASLKNVRARCAPPKSAASSCVIIM
jgi:hypothetical protein